jgi:hypothetical protein
MRFSMRAGLSAMALLATVACGGDATGPVSLADLKTADLDNASSEVALALAHPALQSVVRSGVILNVAPPALKQAGLLLSVQRNPAASQIVASSTVSALATSNNVLPDTSLGKTYVFKDGSYQADPARKGAPSNGLRIVLYQSVDIYGGVSGPEVGILEVVETTTASDAMAFQWRVLDTKGGVLATLNTRMQGEFDGNSMTMTASGTIGAGSKAIAVLDTIRSTTTANGSTSRIMMSTKAPFAGLAFAYGITSAEPASGPSTATYQVDLTVARRRVRLVANYNSSNPAGSDTVQVYLNDRLVGYTLNASDNLGDDLYTSAGEPASEEVKDFFNNIVPLSETLPTGIGTFMLLLSFLGWAAQID